MNKGLAITLSVIGVIIIALVAGFFILTADRTPAAILNLESEGVEVNLGTGWIPAIDEMKLKEKASVKTNEGQATLILYESVIVSLDPNTEVKIDQLVNEHVVVKQESGTSWTKFANIAGVETYEQASPTTVATVRGTSFGMSITEDGTVVICGEGTVKVKSKVESKEVKDLQKLTEIDGILTINELSSKELETVKIALKTDLMNLKDLRNNIIQRQNALTLIKRLYALSDADIQEKLEEIDKGELDDKMLAEKSPVNVGAADKLLNLNDEVKEQQDIISSLG